MREPNLNHIRYLIDEDLTICEDDGAHLGKSFVISDFEPNRYACKDCMVRLNMFNLKETLQEEKEKQTKPETPVDSGSFGVWFALSFIMVLIAALFFYDFFGLGSCL